MFISNEGDGAHAVEQCALSHHPVTGAPYPQYDPGYKPCATSVTNRIQPLAPSYTFFVPAPAKPSGSALLRYRVVTRVPGSSGVERVQVKANGIAVTVRVRGSRHLVQYGKSFFVSWTGAVPHPPTTLKLSVKSILINHADPNPAVPDPSGAHWALYLDVNGYWQLLNAWAPRLTMNVVDGERIAVNRTVTIHVPYGAGVSVLLQGRECDEPAGKTILGIYANLLYPCPANTDEQNPNILDLFANDDPGTILNIYRSATAAIGTHVATSASSVNFPGSGPTSFADVKGQGQGDYQLTYAIRRG